jgi:methylated-DNA-[protein]-cysteine S-methyltransferase
MRAELQASAQEEPGALRSRALDTAIGRLVITAHERGLTRLELRASGAWAPLEPGSKPVEEHLGRAERALREYFAGVRRDFLDLALAPQGTAFQLAVWRALLEIPYGETIAYRELARRAGSAAAVRAAGHANGRNPLPVLVPCHRAVGTDGSLTGFGLGLDVKAWLLAHEGATAPLRGAVTAKSRLQPLTAG